MNTALQDNTTRHRIEQLENDALPIPDMTVGEWMQLSLLSMFDNKEVNRNTLVMYGGGIYNVHICISFAKPPEDMEAIQGKQ